MVVDSEPPRMLELHLCSMALSGQLCQLSWGSVGGSLMVLPNQIGSDSLIILLIAS
jgi:hypothetical protein